MTFNSTLRCGIVALGWIAVGTAVQAAGALGEFHSVARPVAFAARSAASMDPGTASSAEAAPTSTALPYNVAEEVRPDGSRIRRYLAPNGQVFAISWNTLYKPNLSNLLGNSFPSYATAAQAIGKRGGIQRHFRYEGIDLVVQSTGHLHVFHGYAYRTSLFPQGINVASVGLE
jgi:beta-xylosidase